MSMKVSERAEFINELRIIKEKMSLVGQNIGGVLVHDALRIIAMVDSRIGEKGETHLNNLIRSRKGKDVGVG